MRLPKSHIERKIARILKRAYLHDSSLECLIDFGGCLSSRWCGTSSTAHEDTIALLKRIFSYLASAHGTLNLIKAKWKRDILMGDKIRLSVPEMCGGDR
jgi:hypothetical protein